ncbi:MAG: ATP-binding protein [Actinobacteria bacterium]|nr:ATP-binding protein [Actinomycetota bacterium]
MITEIQSHRASSFFTPASIRTIEDTGLGVDFLSELVLKVVYYAGSIRGGQVAQQIGLPFTGVTDRLLDTLRHQAFVEVKGGSSMFANSYEYAMTGKGSAKALELIEKCTYAGVAPVPLSLYRQAVQGQAAGSTIGRDALIRALSHLVLSDKVLNQIGPAINSGRSIFLFGPPGNGKTSIAEAAPDVLGGAVYVPYALEFDSQVIQVYDPTHHRQVGSNGQQNDSTDRRWVLCRRPAVIAGGELTLSTLDLTYGESSRYYEAPLQLKANNGVLLIDDFGRQEVRPRDLLNRWIVPLEKREDYLNLQSGQRLNVPFEQLVIFSTNMEPKSLVDEAFLRRIRYKIHVPDPTRDEYLEILRRVCQERGIPCDAAAQEYLFQYYADRGIQPRGCHPRDLVDQLADVSRYMGVEPRLTRDMLELACDSYFVKL